MKISVISVPEKGKANKELINFLSKEFKVAKSDMEIVYGEADRYKKVLVRVDNEVVSRIERFLSSFEMTRGECEE